MMDVASPPQLRDLPVGYDLPPLVFKCTQAAIARHSVMGRCVMQGPLGLESGIAPNIHTDPAYARSQGLPNAVATGMIFTEWLSYLLVRFFGEGYVQGGGLTAKFIRLVFPGETILVKAKVKERVVDGDAVTYILDMSCENDKGEVKVVGEGKARVH